MDKRKICDVNLVQNRADDLWVHDLEIIAFVLRSTTMPFPTFSIF